MTEKKRKQNILTIKRKQISSISPSQNKSPKDKIKSSKAKFKVNKKAIIFLLISLVSILVVFTGYLFLSQSMPANFSSKLTQVGAIELSYGDKQSEKISPLCGCNDIGDSENWRGITFTARHIEIERKGDLPVTGYLIFPTSPAPTNIYPGAFKMKTAAYVIEINETEEFNPKYLIGNKLPENYKVIKKEESDEGFVQIFSESKLKISLLGDIPLGAWIPMEKSDVSIGYQPGLNLNESATAIIKEKYLKSTEDELNGVWNERGFYQQSKMSMPLGDFLGTNIVLWSEDEPTSVLASTQVFHIPKPGIIGKKIVKGIVVNPPFAVRVVAIPFDTHSMIRSLDEAPKRSENDYSHMTSQGRFDNGEAILRISNPKNQAKEFEKIYKTIGERVTIDSNFKTYNSKEIAGGVMTFRYPPLPPNNGFNIFGKVNNLKIGSTLGNLLIGSRSYNIEAPADLELRDIKELEIKNGIIEVPIQIGIDEVPSKIQLNATSEIHINKESITRRIDNNKTILDYLVLIGTVIGIVTAIVSTVISVKSFTKS